MKFSISTGCFYDVRIHNDIPKDAVDVTDAQFEALSIGRNTGKQIVSKDGVLILVDPEPVVLTREQAEARERVWRNAELERVKWLRERHRDQHEIGVAPALTADQFGELLVYMQALRDWPQSELFPDSEQRPNPPSWVVEHLN